MARINFKAINPTPNITMDIIDRKPLKIVNEIPVNDTCDYGVWGGEINWQGYCQNFARALHQAQEKLHQTEILYEEATEELRIMKNKIRERSNGEFDDIIGSDSESEEEYEKLNPIERWKRDIMGRMTREIQEPPVNTGCGESESEYRRRMDATLTSAERERRMGEVSSDEEIVYWGEPGITMEDEDRLWHGYQ